jgi:hypothetical protein
LDPAGLPTRWQRSEQQAPLLAPHLLLRHLPCLTACWGLFPALLIPHRRLLLPLVAAPPQSALRAHHSEHHLLLLLLLLLSSSPH